MNSYTFQDVDLASPNFVEQLEHQLRTSTPLSSRTQLNANATRSYSRQIGGVPTLQLPVRNQEFEADPGNIGGRYTSPVPSVQGLGQPAQLMYTGPVIRGQNGQNGGILLAAENIGHPYPVQSPVGPQGTPYLNGTSSSHLQPITYNAMLSPRDTGHPAVIYPGGPPFNANSTEHPPGFQVPSIGNGNRLQNVTNMHSTADSLFQAQHAVPARQRQFNPFAYSFNHVEDSPDKLPRVDQLLKGFIERGSNENALKQLNDEIQQSYGVDLKLTKHAREAIDQQKLLAVSGLPRSPFDTNVQDKSILKEVWSEVETSRIAKDKLVLWAKEIEKNVLEKELVRIRAEESALITELKRTTRELSSSSPNISREVLQPPGRSILKSSPPGESITRPPQSLLLPSGGSAGFSAGNRLEPPTTRNVSVNVIALHDFSPRLSDEIELIEGDTVEVLMEFDDGWLLGTSNRTRIQGLFPASYVQALPEDGLLRVAAPVARPSSVRWAP